MINNAKVLAIIPARGGSKSIPRKNIKLLNGVPLIAYSIAAGLAAKSVNRVIISTDDQEIAGIARRYKAEVPFMRPAELGRDDTPDLPVFTHALKWLAEHENYLPDIVVQLRPTSPLRPPDLVDRAVDILLNNDSADSVRAIVPAGQNPYKMWRVTGRGQISPLIEDRGISEAYNMPRQKLPLTYWQTGHVDVIRYSTIMTKRSMSGESILPLILDPRYSIDIDTISDWDRAEWLMEHLELPIVRPE
jgi:N-acylneuraminate cytidylyltransferase